MVKYEEYESILRQKSRVRWLQEGDQNTRFFHSTVKRKRWRNNIQGIRHDGDWITNPERMKEIFVQHFEQRFRSKTSRQCFTLGTLHVKQLNVLEENDLERVFETKEIKEAFVQH